MSSDAPAKFTPGMMVFAALMFTVPFELAKEVIDAWSARSIRSHSEAIAITIIAVLCVLYWSFTAVRFIQRKRDARILIVLMLCASVVARGADVVVAQQLLPGQILGIVTYGGFLGWFLLSATVRETFSR